MPFSLFELLDDYNLCETTLSFCDFHSAVCTGRTCQRLKEISDCVLDQWADKVLSELLPIVGDEHKVHNRGRYDELSALRDGWELRNKPALIAFALSQCGQNVDIGNDTFAIDESKASYLLRTRGRMEAVDLINHVPNEYCPDTQGYTVIISFKEYCSLSFARQFILGANDERLKHASLCILRKCILRKNNTPLRLKFATYKGVYRFPTRTPVHLCKTSSLMIRVNEREIELFSNAYVATQSYLNIR